MLTSKQNQERLRAESRKAQGKMNVSVAKFSKATKIMTEYGEEVPLTEVGEEKIISEAEADKNMNDLLQELDKERQKKESKKAAAAKKREKKKQKKKQKQEVTETEHGKSKNSSPEVESEDSQQLEVENEKEKLVKQPPAATITSTMGSSCVASSTLPMPELDDIFQPIGVERTMRKTLGPNINTEFKGSSWNYDRDLEKLRKSLDKTKSNQDQLKKTLCEKAREASNPSMLSVQTSSELVNSPKRGQKEKDDWTLVTKPKKMQVPASANSRVIDRDSNKIHATHEISGANIKKIKASGATTITVKDGEIRGIHKETFQEVLDQKELQKQTIEAMGMVAGSAIQAPFQAALREEFQNFVIPSLERSINNMYQQVSDTFRRGTEEYTWQLESHLEGLLPKHLEARDPIVAEMRELKDSFKQIQHVLATIQSQINTEVSPAIFYEAVKVAVRDEVAMKMRELGNMISDSVLSAMRSGVVTPVIDTPDHQEKAHIMNLLRQGQFNAAFNKALSAANLDLVISLCEVVNPSQVFNQSPCPLHQPVLICLIQQLSVDLENHTDLKHKYLEQAVVNLDPSDSATQKHMNEVLSGLNQKLRCYIPAHPNDQLTCSLKLLLMATESLLK